MTAVYGWVIGRLLRVAAIVGIVYCGLLFTTWWGVTYAPKGFLPTQDQGYLLVNVQLPDSASVQRTEAIVMKLDKIARSTPGVAHTVGISGTSFLLSANGSNLGSMFVVLDDFSLRTTHDRYDAVIAQKIQERWRRKFKAPPWESSGRPRFAA